MKQMAMNVGALLILLGIFFFVGFAIYAGFYRYGNPKLTETELHIWAILNWWRWLIPLAGLGVGWGLVYWAQKD